MPSMQPSGSPSGYPTLQPTAAPSVYQYPTGQPSNSPSAPPTSSPSRSFNFGGLMLEKHPLGVMILYVCLFYAYRTLGMERMRRSLKIEDQVRQEVLQQAAEAGVVEEMGRLLTEEIERNI